MSIDLDSLVAALKSAVPIARMLANLSATKWDDNAVAVLEALLSNDTLLKFLHSILDKPTVMGLAGDPRTDAILEAAGEFGTPEVQHAAAAAGISWTLLLVYLPTVVRLVLTVMGLRS